MVTLDVRPQEEQKTKVAVRETVDNDIDSSSVEQDRSDISTWSYSMTSPGVCATTLSPGLKRSRPPGKANAWRRVRP